MQSEDFLGEDVEKAILFSKVVMTANIEAGIANATLKLKILKEVVKGVDCGDVELSFIDQVVVDRDNSERVVYTTDIKTPRAGSEFLSEVGGVKFSSHSLVMCSKVLSGCELDSSGNLNVYANGQYSRIPYFCLLAAECELGTIVTFDNFITEASQMFEGDVLRSFLVMESAQAFKEDRVLN